MRQRQFLVCGDDVNLSVEIIKENRICQLASKHVGLLSECRGILSLCLGDSKCVDILLPQCWAESPKSQYKSC
jgi:hypothetical protein